MWKMLKHIAKTHRKRLLGTFSLVGLENLLMLVYPVFGGWAINAVIAGKVWQALLYALVVFLMWLVGAARRIADTRTFTRIYTEIAVPVVLEQRQRQVPHSTVTAQVALSREFVSFFEEHLPIAATSVVSIFGACIMLLVLEFWVGVSAVGILALFLWLLPRFATISENLYFRLNNSLERDNHFIRKGDERQLYRHYGLVARLRVLISNREAFGYLCVGAAMGILFSFAFVMMTLKGYGSAGHIYSVSTYLWMFAMSLDDVPRLVEQYSNLKDIGQRIEWSERNIKSRNLNNAV
nr:ABC transporter six-transmembrane domain-containing protein [Neisseria meningitidis]